MKSEKNEKINTSETDFSTAKALTEYQELELVSFSLIKVRNLLICPRSIAVTVRPTGVT